MVYAPLQWPRSVGLVPGEEAANAEGGTIRAQLSRQLDREVYRFEERRER